MDGIVELAMIIKERDNPSVQGIGVGLVFLDEGALKVRFNGFTLDNTLYIKASHVRLVEGDSVIVIPSAENQIYYIIGKVG